MKLLALLIPVVTIAAIFSCKSKTAETPQEETRDTTTIRLEFSKIYDTTLMGRNVIMEGYFQIPFSMFTFGNAGHSILFTKWKNYPDTMVVRVSLSASEGKNVIIPLPSSYTRNDLKVIADNGDTIRFGQKVRIHGIMNVEKMHAGYDSGKIVPSMNVHLIEKIDEKTEYNTTTIKKHTDPVGSAGLHQTERVYIEGYVDIPRNMMGLRGITLHMRTGENMDLVGLHVLTDNGPNSVHIPRVYLGPDDIKLQDHKGALIPFTVVESTLGADFNTVRSKKKVRAYGIWHKGADQSSGDLYVEYLEEIDGSTK